MLVVKVPAREQLDELNNEFVSTKATTLQLEHSLVSISKWEAKWHKPFFEEQKTAEQTLDYIRCMTITQNVDPNVYTCLTSENVKMIEEYINDPMTATWFSEQKQNGRQKSRPKRQKVTSELIYYWMIALNIPLECQKWHINRLITLIRVCNEENRVESDKIKRPTKSSLANRASLNAARRKKLHSRG